MYFSPVPGSILLEAGGRSGPPQRAGALARPLRSQDLFPVGKVQLKMAVAEDFHFSHQGVPPL